MVGMNTKTLSWESMFGDFFLSYKAVVEDEATLTCNSFEVDMVAYMWVVHMLTEEL